MPHEVLLRVGPGICRSSLLGCCGRAEAGVVTTMTPIFSAPSSVASASWLKVGCVVLYPLFASTYSSPRTLKHSANVILITIDRKLRGEFAGIIPLVPGLGLGRSCAWSLVLCGVVGGGTLVIGGWQTLPARSSTVSWFPPRHYLWDSLGCHVNVGLEHTRGRCATGERRWRPLDGHGRAERRLTDRRESVGYGAVSKPGRREVEDARVSVD